MHLLLWICTGVSALFVLFGIYRVAYTTLNWDQLDETAIAMKVLARIEEHGMRNGPMPEGMEDFRSMYVSDAETALLDAEASRPANLIERQSRFLGYAVLITCAFGLAAWFI